MEVRMNEVNKLDDDVDNVNNVPSSAATDGGISNNALLLSFFVVCVVFQCLFM